MRGAVVNRCSAFGRHVRLTKPSARDLGGYVGGAPRKNLSTKAHWVLEGAAKIIVPKIQDALVRSENRAYIGSVR